MVPFSGGSREARGFRRARLGFVVGFIALLAAHGQALAALTIDDVISMSKAKLAPDVIITTIRASKVQFKLTARQMIALKKAGVHDSVIKALVETTTTPPTPEPKVSPSEVPAAVPSKSLSGQQATRLAADAFRRAEQERKAE